MRIVWVLALLGACVDENKNEWRATASCTIHASAGEECFEYDLTAPAQRDSLSAQCMGQWREDDSCETDNRIAGCELDAQLLHGSYIYAGYTDVLGFSTECKAKGGHYDGP
ncbi:MAG: hypothetical protein QM831_20890 [Kofleriaceae bacterium]